MNREAKNYEFRFENEYFPDTEGVVFDAATVEGEEAEEIEELDKGNESMKNNKNDLFLNDVYIYSLSVQ